MVYERRVTSRAALKRELETMDPDAGVRVKVVVEGKNGLAFVTRFGKGYIAIIHSVADRPRLKLGERLLSKEFKTAAGVAGFLAGLAGDEVQAYAY